MNWYNENNATVAQVLRELISEGAIPEGYVDERDIRSIPTLEGYTQYHFFAGIGGWSVALKLAGWPADRPVITGSCPCQPFSIAGHRKGTADERHLWPDMQRLISQLGVSTVFGEQVASPDGRRWLSGVRSDLEALGYAVGAADLCAAGVGAPHIRQRLYWYALRLADTGIQDQGWRRVFRSGEGAGESDRASLERSARLRSTGRMAKHRRHGITRMEHQRER